VNRPRPVAEALSDPLHSGAILRNLLSGVRRPICWQRFLALLSSKLPAFDFEEVLEMFLAIFGFPIVTPQLRFNDDLLAFLSQSSEMLSRLLPLGHVYESSGPLALAIAVAEEFVVSDCGGRNRSSRISLSQGRISDQVTTNDDAVDIHE
jgi:hypothetical protein